MELRRIQVEEGFLDGLDLKFAPGLNVLIGPRGTGKTSIIELIRYCLGSEPLTERAVRTSIDHAQSILGSGSVSITVREGSHEFTIQRTADRWSLSQHLANPPLVLSQNEIEAIGLHAAGRLRLLDLVADTSAPAEAESDAGILSSLQSLAEEAQSTQAELHTIENDITALRKQLKDSASLRKQHLEALKGIDHAKKETERLAVLDKTLSETTVRAALFDRIVIRLRERQQQVRAIQRSPAFVDQWPEAAGKLESADPLESARSNAHRSDLSLVKALEELDAAALNITELAEANARVATTQQEEARTIRRKLEAIQEGAGQAARALAQIKEQEGQLSALVQRQQATAALLESLRRERDTYLDSLEQRRGMRFERRSLAANRLNSTLGPRIRVNVERAGLLGDYANAVVAALRGSGIHYAEIGPQISEQMSPREFVRLCETRNVEELARLAGVTQQRAMRIIDRVNEQSTENILTAQIDDGVMLSLLDGREYKSTEEISMGQRCTVVLPILLQQQNTTLVVDQPEDHLDNAFIVETLIKAIHSHSRTQLIFATHNANIPVLGNADAVVLMGSDGRRGFVEHVGALDHPASVRAITTIMEGGLQAFDRRHEFYHRAKGVT